jgi:putative transposase
MASTTSRVRVIPLKALNSKQFNIIRNGQIAAGGIWKICRDLHAQARLEKTAWPTRDMLQHAIKGHHGIHSQSAQMVAHAFLANVETIRQLKISGNAKACYPWRDKYFYPLLWPSQAMSLRRDNKIILPMGRGTASLVLPKPDWLESPCAARLIWNGAHYELHVTQQVPVPTQPPGTNRACIDLGQIHQCAIVTDTGSALIVSGRGIRSLKRLTSKTHGKLAMMQSKCKRGSKRSRRLFKVRNKLARRNLRRIRDARHKGTRAAINFCIKQKVGSLFIGNPDGVRRKPCGNKHNQRMSQWEYGKDINYLEQKAELAAIQSFTGSERGTSSQCPTCGHKHKPKGRNWTCKACGFTGHRDLVGATNMHPIAFNKKVSFPSAKDTTYQRPAQDCKIERRPVVVARSRATSLTARVAISNLERMRQQSFGVSQKICRSTSLQK